MVLCNRISSEQEEADTKVFLCAQFAFDIGFERVNIVTVDTDVAILGMYFQSKLNGKIYLQYGTSSATTLYDLSENSLDRSLYLLTVLTVLIDKIHVQSKVESISSNVQCVS